MAMLFSVMSFAKTEEISCAAGTIVNKSITFDFESMTVLHAQGTSTSEVKSYSPWRVYKNHVVTFTPATDVTIESLVITCSGSSYAANGTLSNATATLDGTTLTITPTDGTKAFTFAASQSQVRWSRIVVNYSLAGEVIAVEAPEFDVTTANFQEAFTLNITSAEGTTLKYTTDQTNPATSETAIEVATNTAAVQITKSTQVRAIAIKGSDVSEEKKMTYCFVNTPATAYTVAEAMEVIDAGLGLGNELYIKGTVSKVESYNESYGSITYWIEDEEGNEFECYSGLGLNKAKFTAKEDIEIGAYVVACGVMKKYKTIYEFDYNNYLVEYNAPAVEEPTIECKDALDFGAVVYTDEVEGQTLEVTGYNLTSDITVTLSNDVFAVDQTTLPAEGGELVVTPVSPLTAGTHTATLTLTSGEATAEVTLTIVAKDVYTITWSVNGETTTTSVVEGDKLVLPAAPEAPEACSEKVFVGWTAAEEVNADGSDITWVTAATAPTAAATYYAVFAVQEGEGGLSEVDDVLDRALTGVEGTSYASWADVSVTSDAVYAGQSAGGNEAIQLRSNNNNSGVISTTSGGKLAKVVVSWNSNTAAGRTLNIYGSNSAYTAPTDLYSDASGEKLGTIVCGTSTELVIEGDYAYVGLRSNSGAMYLDEIQITWTTGAAATYTDYSTTCEAEIEWMEMELEINNLITEVMEVGGAKYLMMMGGNEEMGKSVNIFLNNYADVDDDYEVNAESSLIVFMGYEFTVLEGTISQTSETEKGTLYTGTVSATGIVDGETMYVKFDLTMYAAPTTVLVLTNAIVAINEELETLTFNVPTGEGEGYFVELSGYTAPGVHEGAQICLFETPEVVAYATYVETEVVDGVITLTGEFTSPMGPKFDLTISGKLPGGSTVGLENLDTTVAPAKAIVNGQLVIIKNGVQYNATGAVVK